MSEEKRIVDLSKVNLYELYEKGGEQALDSLLKVQLTKHNPDALLALVHHHIVIDVKENQSHYIVAASKKINDAIEKRKKIAIEIRQELVSVKARAVEEKEAAEKKAEEAAKVVDEMNELLEVAEAELGAARTRAAKAFMSSEEEIKAAEAVGAAQAKAGAARQAVDNAMAESQAAITLVDNEKERGKREIEQTEERFRDLETRDSLTPVQVLGVVLEAAKEAKKAAGWRGQNQLYKRICVVAQQWVENDQNISSLEETLSDRRVTKMQDVVTQASARMQEGRRRVRDEARAAIMETNAKVRSLKQQLRLEKQHQAELKTQLSYYESENSTLRSRIEETGREESGFGSSETLLKQDMQIAEAMGSSRKLTRRYEPALCLIRLINALKERSRQGYTAGSRDDALYDIKTIEQCYELLIPYLNLTSPPGKKGEGSTRGILTLEESKLTLERHKELQRVLDLLDSCLNRLVSEDIAIHYTNHSNAQYSKAGELFNNSITNTIINFYKRCCFFDIKNSKVRNTILSYGNLLNSAKDGSSFAETYFAPPRASASVEANSALSKQAQRPPKAPGAAGASSRRGSLAEANGVTGSVHQSLSGEQPKLNRSASFGEERASLVGNKPLKAPRRSSLFNQSSPAASEENSQQASLLQSEAESSVSASALEFSMVKHG
jgi:hypothetical protein